LRIGVDLMGMGIHPDEAASAIREALEIVDAEIHIFAIQDILEPFQKLTRVVITEVDEFIRMDEPPIRALINKPKSSLVLSVKALSEKKLDALVTLGSTGSVIGAATLYLPLLVKRPFLLATLPSKSGPMLVADVGGTVNPKLNMFRDLALVSSAYCGDPVRLGLLNIGEEATKGTGVQREAFYLLEALGGESNAFTFMGNIEPHNAFSGVVNVLITDGFTGNIFLKTAEGAADFILRSQSVNAFDSADYAGAFVAGVDAVMVKCHGHSTRRAIVKGIEQAARALKSGLLESVKEKKTGY